MNDALLEERSLLIVASVLVVGTIISGLSGYFLTTNFQVTGIWDLMTVVLIYLLTPTLVAFFGYFLGWRAKKRAVIYVRPSWKFEPVELSIDECILIAKQYSKSFNLVPHSNLLYYLIPPLFIVFLTSLPLVAIELIPSIAPVVPYMAGMVFASVFLLTMYGSFRASSNAASIDFTPPSLREVIWLAKVQQRLPGSSTVSIYLDKAEFGKYVIYRDPRVILRIKGIEKSGLVKSVSEDIGSVSKVMGWLRPIDSDKAIIWSWQAQDREFWKQAGSVEEGYYVTRPIPSIKKTLDVKDVNLVIKNAIALVIIEWLKINGNDELLRGILDELGAVIP